MLKERSLSLVASVESAPEPPYPPDTRAKGWRFELDYERIEQSDTWALATPETRPWLLMIWMTAWRQSPCGALPSSDTLIAARIGMPERQFAANRDILMRGWYLANDGRLYHPALTDHVIAMTRKRGDDATRIQARRKMAASVHARDGGCVYCGSTEGLTLDHLLPLRLGGDNHEDNVASACRSCNSTKSGRTPEAAGLRIINRGASARWARYKENQQLSGNVAATPCESLRVAATSTPEPEPEPEEKQRSKAVPPIAPRRRTTPSADAVKIMVADGVSDEAASAWMQVRRAKRLPLTDLAWRDVKEQAALVSMTPHQAVDYAARRSWGGFKASWVERDRASGNGTKSGQTKSIAGMNYSEGFDAHGNII